MANKSGSYAFVVLLRGVNVGRGNRVPMAEFRQMLEGIGFSHVATLLNSGNAVFRANHADVRSHILAITNALTARFGIVVSVIVVPSETLDQVIATCPLVVDQAEHPRFLVAFAASAETLSGLAPVSSLITPPERFAIGQHAAYLHCARGILESKAATALLGKVGKQVTTRNLATVLKVQAALQRIREQK